MRRTTFDERRDLAIADRVTDPVDVVGRCAAHGCPNIWTTESSRLCRRHSAEPDKHLWPKVSEDLRIEITDRALDRQIAPPARSFSLSEKRAILAKLRTLFTDKATRDPKAWAYELRRREKDGETLSSAQQAMWRAAVEDGSDFVAPDDYERLKALKAESKARAQAYAEANGIPYRDVRLADFSPYGGGDTPPVRARVPESRP